MNQMSIMIAHDMNHTSYWIWKLIDGKMKDLDLNLRTFGPEHVRFDIFINGNIFWKMIIFLNMMVKLTYQVYN